MEARDRNILQRLNAVMQQVDYIQKEKKAGMNYTIVSHDAVTAKVRPHLVKEGIVYYPHSIQAGQDGDRTSVQLKVRFANVDNPDDFIDVESLGYGVDKQDKGPGKAISYAVKYCLLKALGLETGDDADNESIDHTPQVLIDFERELDAATDLDDLEDAGKKYREAILKLGKSDAVTRVFDKFKKRKADFEKSQKAA